MSETIRKATSTDLALLVLLAVIWASAFQAIKVAVVETGPLWLVAARVGIAFVVLLPWTLYRGAVLPASRQQWMLVLAIVALNVLAPFFLISFAEQTISSGETALLLGAGPLFGLIASHLTTDDDRLNGRKVLAVIVGFTGVASVIGTQAIDAIGDHVVAQGAVLAASACYVSSGLFVRRVEGIPPTRLTTLSFGIATAVIIPIALALNGPPAQPSSTALLSMLYLGVIPTGVAAILRFQLVRKVGVSMFAHVGNLIPVFGVVFGALLLDEAISTTTIIALVLILSGVAIARSGARRSVVH